MGLIRDLLIKKPSLSHFNTSYVNRFNCFVGGLYPAYRQTIEANTTVVLSTSMAIRTNPMLAPLMGRFKVTLDYFFAPKRLYNYDYQLNSNTFDFFETAHPLIKFSEVPTDSTGSVSKSNYVNRMVKPGSLLDFLGFPRFFAPVAQENTAFNAYYYLAYHDIYRNYYIDQQWDTYAVAAGLSSPMAAESFVRVYPVSQLDQLRQLNHSNSGVINPLPDSLFLGSGAGILLKTYEPDLFNTYLNKQSLSNLYTENAISSSDGVISWQQVRTSAILTQMRELTQLIGGRFDDWLAGFFGQTSRKDMEIPQFICRCNMDVFADEVTATADTGSTGNKPIGSQAGKVARFGSNFRRWTFHASEPGVILGLFSITPIVDYCQGIDPFLLKKSARDDFNPKTDNISFQDIPVSWVYAAPWLNPSTLTTDRIPTWVNSGDTYKNPFDVVLGSQPSFSEYTTRCNEVHGDFTDTLSYWTNIRKFDESYGGASRSITLGFSPRQLQPSSQGFFGSYIDPTIWNRPFTIQNPNAANWQVQISFDVKTTFPKKKTPLPTQL